jgi:predicted protein tyrosine phosphatase
MPRILVTPLSAVPQTIALHRPSHLVTLLSPEHMIDTPDGVEAHRHLKLGMNDIADAFAGDAPPAANHIESLLEFGRTWNADAPMLIHCWAGISRSTAAAYILLCDRFGDGHETILARELRLRAPHAYPNRLMVRLADNALGREGRMIDAIETIGRGRIVSEGDLAELPLALDTP